MVGYFWSCVSIVLIWFQATCLTQRLLLLAQNENGNISYEIYRPIGQLRLCVVKGRNIRSPELGLPGNVGCNIRWNPTLLFDEIQKKQTIEIDESAGTTHEIGSTNFVYSINPVWGQMEESDESKRLNLLIPTDQGAFFDLATKSDECEMIKFPVLQPLGKRGDRHCLVPWESSGAAIVVEVQFTDLLNIIPGSDYSVGDFAILFKDIVRNGNISGWYDINIAGQGGSSTACTKPEVLDQAGAKRENSPSDNKPQIYVKATWTPLEEQNIALDTTREASHAIQEEFVRSALLMQRQAERLGIIGSSIGALNSVRGISSNLQMIQNTLGSTLDLCESCIHVFDFTVRLFDQWVGFVAY